MRIKLSWPEDVDTRKRILDATAGLLEQFDFGVPVVVWDDGHEPFGVFDTPKAAAAALRDSNPAWWAGGPCVTEE